MYLYIYTYIHKHIYIYSYDIYISTCMYIYIHVCIYTYVHIYICTHVSCNNTCMHDSSRIRALSVDRYNKPSRSIHQVSAVSLRNTLERRQRCCLHAGPTFERWFSYGQRRLFVCRFLQECHVSGRGFPTCVNDSLQIF